jgi:hypothetical protein
VLRDFIALISGVLVHYLLLIASSRLAWFLIVGNVDRATAGYKGALVNWMLWRTFAIDPMVAVLVGGFVAFVARRSQWWLGGIATLPLLLYVSVHSADRIEIGSSVVYMVLAFGAAFVVWRFRRSRSS